MSSARRLGCAPLLGSWVGFSLSGAAAIFVPEMVSSWLWEGKPRLMTVLSRFCVVLGGLQPDLFTHSSKSDEAPPSPSGKRASTCHSCVVDGATTIQTGKVTAALASVSSFAFAMVFKVL